MNEPVADVIRAEQLGKTYAEGKLHTPVFDGLDLTVAAGETVAIVGASGAGKAASNRSATSAGSRFSIWQWGKGEAV